MAERCAVVGIGQTKHDTKRVDVSLPGLLREAAGRAFEDAAVSWRDVADRYPRGSDDHDALRVVIEHWELIAALTLAGAIDEALLFTSTGEHLTVWSKLQPWLEDARAELGDPAFLDGFELLVRRHAEWLRRTPPLLARAAERRSGS